MTEIIMTEMIHVSIDHLLVMERVQHRSVVNCQSEANPFPCNHPGKSARR